MTAVSTSPGRTGGCQCGAVRYALHGATSALYVCHCNECRKQSASAFGVSVSVARDALHLIGGTPKWWSRPTDSGRVLECAFCADCGSRLWHQRRGDELTVNVKGGSLDEAIDLRTAVHIWTARSCPGVVIPAGATRFPGEPSAAQWRQRRIVTIPSSTSPADPQQPPRVRAIRPEQQVLTRQRLPYFVGISGATAGTHGLSMHLVVIPPGTRAEPHAHRGYETAIYVLSGRVETRWGEGLAQSVISEAGDFLSIPPDVPHEAINLSATEPARAIVARNDPAEQDNVVPYRP